MRRDAWLRYRLNQPSPTRGGIRNPELELYSSCAAAAQLECDRIGPVGLDSGPCRVENTGALCRDIGGGFGGK